MLSIIIKDSGEPKVIELTYENIWKEIKDIPDVELLVRKCWIDSIEEIKSRYVCLLEPDCLVSPGYFAKQLDVFKKNPMYRKTSMITSSVGVGRWDNKFYGYAFVDNFNDGIVPVKDNKSKNIYAVQIGYVPGAIIHTKMLQRVIKDTELSSVWENDLISFSTKLSLAFWKQGDFNKPLLMRKTNMGNPVYINPDTIYVTTENYVNNISRYELADEGLINMFASKCI